MNILFKNAHLIDPALNVDSVADIHIVHGIIQKIGRVSFAKGAEVYDLAEKIVAPGFVDMHVHLREPGYEYKETIETGCRAAASGGFTAVCCMPNTNPAIDDASVVKNILERARSVLGGIVDVYPIAAVTKGREGKELAPMMELADAGAVGFTDDGAPVEQAEIMRRALEYASMIGKPIIQHAEDLTLTKGGAMNEGFISTGLGLPGMPQVAEEVMVARDIRMVEYIGAPYHVAHISTRGTVELVRSTKAKKLPVTCEVTPHHFTLTDEAVRSFDTNTKMNPPLRTQEDIEAIKEGLRDGTIDVIATDHAPHSQDEKEVEFAFAPFGIVGLETAIGLAITELVELKVLTLSQLIEKFSINPRKILKLSSAKIAEGERANLTIVDPKSEWVVDIRQFKSKSKNSPFHGRTLRGKAFAVINNNQLLFSD
ncbi:MAG: dihydroorotase [Ignavibacteriae bacterium]|nr:dihydroorotase [Ignavibacteria bacterium]MBI3364284.1 dihydroorotase [Ignavibacteriota bacterium]